MQFCTCTFLLAIIKLWLIATGKSGPLIIWWLLSSLTIFLIYLCSLVLFYHVSHFINSNFYLACTHIAISFYEWLNMLFAFRSCSVWSALEYELERKVGKLLVMDWLPVARYTTEGLLLKHGCPPIAFCQIQANVIQKWTFATASRGSVSRSGEINRPLQSGDQGS